MIGYLSPELIGFRGRVEERFLCNGERERTLFALSELWEQILMRPLWREQTEEKLSGGNGAEGERWLMINAINVFLSSSSRYSSGVYSSADRLTWRGPHVLLLGVETQRTCALHVKFQPSSDPSPLRCSSVSNSQNEPAFPIIRAPE